MESQLPFGSVPFRHSRTRSSPTSRMPSSLNYLSAQCPFGTLVLWLRNFGAKARLNYLSAQCPFGTRRWPPELWRSSRSVSITFRLSALSAHVPRHVVTKSGGFVSITFRLSALSALSWVRGWPPRTEFQLGLNYLSAQCPFGTDEERHPDRRPVLVSITFRLSALSAQDGFKLGTWLATTYVSITFRLSALSAHGPGSPGPGRPVGRLNYLSAQCPFGTPVLATETH